MENVLTISKIMREDCAKKYNIKKYINNIVICNNDFDKNHYKNDKLNKILKNALKDENKKHKFSTKPLSKKEIKSLYDLINDYSINSEIKMNKLKKPKYEEIMERFTEILDRPLPGSIKNKKELNKKLKEFIINKKENKLIKNVLIMGAGPSGLLIALYLNNIYNKNPITNDNINIMIIDNRITKEGYREPYTRTRFFAYSIYELSILYNKLYCDNKTMNPINYIENLGYINLFSKGKEKENGMGNGKVEMYFTKEYEEWNKVCKLMKKGNFDVMFDATGGRLKTPLMKKPNISKFNKVYNNYELVINKDNVILESKLENDPLMNIFTTEYYDKNKKLLDENDECKQCKTLPTCDIGSLHTCDIGLYKKVQNILLNKDSVKILSTLVKDKIDKNIFKSISNSMNKSIFYCKIVLIPVYIHHKMEIAKVYNYDKHKFIYIGSGDTIFHSHFIRGAGLNITISFILRVLYLI